MGKLSFGMMVSADGYVAGPADGASLPAPNEELHQYFNDLQKETALNLYGRRMYEVMRYWDDADQKAESSPVEVDYARAWQRTPKVVVSTTLTSVGPNALLVNESVEQAVSALRAEVSGHIEVAGPTLAASLARWGLLDEYCLYICPLVLGGGTPFFEVGRALALERVGVETLPQDVLLVRYRPAR
jgi:dihydrofolate reductase